MPCFSSLKFLKLKKSGFYKFLYQSYLSSHCLTLHPSHLKKKKYFKNAYRFLKIKVEDWNTDGLIIRVMVVVQKSEDTLEDILVVKP